MTGAGLRILAAALLLAAAAPAAAQPADLRAEFDAAFQAMLSDPGNVDKTIRYAELASRIGDAEAAIGALERLLLVNRDLAKVHLELGELYYRLDSYAPARRYFESALAAADTTPAVQERARGFITEIDRRTARSSFAGTVTAGMRYESNANFGPDSRFVRAGGNTTLLPSGSTRRSDWNGYLNASLAHTYDLDRQDGLLLESTASLYVTRYVDETQLDLGFLELTSGPRIYLDRDRAANRAISVRPHVIVNGIMIDDARYSWAYGGGIGLRYEIGRTVLDATYQLRERSVRNSAARPTASDLSGPDHSLVLTGRYTLGSSTLLNWELIGGYNDAEKDFNANLRYGGMLGLTQQFAAPWGLTAGRWSLVGTVGYTGYEYEAPDPSVDPNVTRRDKEWRASLAQVVPVAQSWSLTLQVEYLKTESNIPNYQYENVSVLLAVGYRF